MSYTIKQIAEILQAEISGSTSGVSKISTLNIDTRKVSDPFHALFFAIKGPRNDGHLYLSDAYHKGIRNFVISDLQETTKFPGATFLKVANTLEALQNLAAYHRAKFSGKVIGITGSNGKTIIKEWLYQLLMEDFSIARSPKSYNSQVGVPLSIWNIGEEHQLAIIEAGISRPGEMEKLEKIIAPDMGIFTNIGPAHSAGFASDDEKLNEKLKLFEHSKTIIYCKDHSLVDHALQNDKRTFSWGLNSRSDVIIKDIATKDGASVLDISYKNQEFTISIPFSDKASIENAMYCVTTMLYLDVPLEKIIHRIALLRNIPMRLELVYGINDCTIIDDSYSADFLSLKIALDFYSQQELKKKKTLIISAFEESGVDETEFCERLNKILAEYNIEKLIAVGNVFFTHKNYLDTTSLEFLPYKDTDTLLSDLGNMVFDRELILVKGARNYHFEKVSSFLQGQSHRTILEINLNALVHNLNVYRAMLNHGTGIIAMVKAFSYGAGSVEIAHLLQSENVDYLAVAYVDEGVTLRKSGIRMPIMVLNPDVGEFPQMAHYNLEPEIYSINQLEQLAHFLDSSQLTKEFVVHIKLETGMNRLGFIGSDVEDVLKRISSLVNLKIGTIFSHLAGSDESIHDDFTEQQIAEFERLCHIIKSKIAYPVKMHLLNSSGIARFQNAHYDYVRLGIGLYGVDSSSTIQEKLQTIGKLKSRISQVKSVPKNHSIGYSRKGWALEDKKIAVIALGYADGYDRRFSNGVGEMYIREQKAKVIGNVCMDMVMVDVTHINGVSEGDEVEVYGQNISIIEMAQRIGTIPYELLTHISGRVKRVYFWD